MATLATDLNKNQFVITPALKNDITEITNALKATISDQLDIIAKAEERMRSYSRTKDQSYLKQNMENLNQEREFNCIKNLRQFIHFLEIFLGKDTKVIYDTLTDPLIDIKLSNFSKDVFPGLNSKTVQQISTIFGVIKSHKNVVSVVSQPEHQSGNQRYKGKIERQADFYLNNRLKGPTPSDNIRNEFITFLSSQSTLPQSKVLSAELVKNARTAADIKQVIGMIHTDLEDLYFSHRARGNTIDISSGEYYLTEEDKKIILKLLGNTYLLVGKLYKENCDINDLLVPFGELLKQSRVLKDKKSMSMEARFVEKYIDWILDLTVRRVPDLAQNAAPINASRVEPKIDPKIDLKDHIDPKVHEEVEVKFHYDTPEADQSDVSLDKNRQQQLLDQHRSVVTNMANLSNTLAQTQAMLKQHETALDSLKHAVGVDVRSLKDKQLELETLIAREQDLHHEAQEKQLILQDDKLCDFYYVFQLRFNDVLLACKAIHSGMINQNETGLADQAARIVENVGRHIPIAGLIADIFAGALRLYSYRDKQQAVNRGANFFTGAASCEKIGEIIARKLTLAQMKDIKAIPTGPQTGFFRRQLQKLGNMIDKLVVNDIDNNIKKLADKQCQMLLTAIMQKGGLKPHPDVKDVDDIIRVILGAAFTYQSPVKTVESVVSTAKVGSNSNGVAAAAGVQTAVTVVQPAATAPSKLPIAIQTYSPGPGPGPGVDVSELYRLLREQQDQIRAQEAQQEALKEQLRLQAQADEKRQQEQASLNN